MACVKKNTEIFWYGLRLQVYQTTLEGTIDYHNYSVINDPSEYYGINILLYELTD